MRMGSQMSALPPGVSWVKRSSDQTTRITEDKPCGTWSAASKPRRFAGGMPCTVIGSAPLRAAGRVTFDSEISDSIVLVLLVSLAFVFVERFNRCVCTFGGCCAATLRFWLKERQAGTLDDPLPSASITDPLQVRFHGGGR